MEIQFLAIKLKRKYNSINMNFIFKNRFTIIGILMGAVAAYIYYHFIGCASGTCAITSNPFLSILYGASLGGLLTNIYQDLQSKKMQKKK